MLGALVGEIEKFAVDLRALHVAFGSPSYKMLAEQAKCSRATISCVFGGEKLPNWAVVEALLGSYGCDEQAVSAWLERWRSIRRSINLVLADGDPVASVDVETGEPIVDMAGR